MFRTRLKRTTLAQKLVSFDGIPCYVCSVEQRYAWLWDVDMDAAAFEAIIAGSGEISLKDRQWAMVRLIEYAPWTDIRRLLPRSFFLEQWPSIAPRVRSRMRRAGMNFLHTWYREHSNE